MVYVDQMRAQLGRMRMSHMVADTTEELLAMADRIGVRREWLQHPGAPDEHFDVADSKRREALAAGAVAVSPREIVAVIRRKREGGNE